MVKGIREIKIPSTIQDVIMARVDSLPEGAREVLQTGSVVASYLDRDIVEFLRAENVRGFNAFLQLLAGQTGQLINLNELANTLALSRDTLSRYFAYLENTFMVRVLRPFVGNRRGEPTKMPKVCFADLGLRNLLAGRLTARLSPADRRLHPRHVPYSAHVLW